MTTPHHQNRILDKTQIDQKIIRMAYELYEHNVEEQELVLAGIQPNGYTLAQRLAAQLEQISPIKVQLLAMTVDKAAPQTVPVELAPTQTTLEDKVVVVVDDVLNTGKTLAYTLNALLQHSPRRLEVATLVNRHHTHYPIAATYTGFSLATTMREHVQVVLTEEEAGAYLL
ncbi:phosphoribosyltransferase family protein [Pontibacter chitinilyticus]|uniref:phosphoribosyltransferase family protein n=1 Tax=Pontibacter chitinilyticus TaxID=2674989 RepID=UPI003218F7EB